MKVTADLDKVSKEVIEIRIRSYNSVIFKEKCNLNNKKKLGRIFDLIKFKYGLDMTDVIKNNIENNWF